MNAARRDAITEATLMDRFSDNMSQFVDWIDARFPMTKMLKEHATEYYAAKNFNVLYVFGVLAMVVLILQLVTGIFLTMSYKPDAEKAFASVEEETRWAAIIIDCTDSGLSTRIMRVFSP